MGKMMVGCISILLAGAVFITYCCVCVGSREDKAMEELFRMMPEGKEEGNG